MKKTLDIKDEKSAFIMELLRNFSFVKTVPLSTYKESVIKGVKKGVTEGNLIIEGKLKGIPTRDLLNEL
ncbi:MAG: hypothetical protein ACOYMA_16545 [Bacteroidia bacterium]